MSDQQVLTQVAQETQVSTVAKVERSQANTTCRLAYDCLVSSTKSFGHNFNLLSDEEKLEYKSLMTYVKQLTKCAESFRATRQSTTTVTPKRVAKPKALAVATESVAVVESVAETSAPVVVETVTETTAATAPVKKPTSSRKKVVKSEKAEQSPTAQEVSALVATEAVSAQVSTPVVEVAAPVVEVTAPVIDAAAATPSKKSSSRKAPAKK